MLYALLNNEKIKAIPKAKAKCPLCEKDVFSKCGDVYAWHWAHENQKSCDNWFEPETQWHKDWKDQFGEELSEIIITKDGKKHIADILTKDKIVIELQNSTILKPTIQKRELFYGQKMLWIINGIDFKSNFQIICPEESNRFYPVSQGFVHKRTGQLVKNGEKYFIWKWSRESWDETQRPVFIDFGEDYLFWVKAGMGLNNGLGKYVTKKEFLNKYLK
jgi:competence protein CoiA